MMLSVPVLIIASCLSQAYGSALPVAGGEMIARQEPVKKETIVAQDPFFNVLQKEKRDLSVRKKKQTTLEHLTEILKTRTAIQKGNPPVGDINWQPLSPTCMLSVQTCVGWGSFVRQTLLSTESLTVDMNTNLEVSRSNEGTRPMKIDVKSSTAVTVGTQNGWNIGLKVTGAVSGVGGEISGGYSSTTTKSTVQTKEVSDSMECPPNNECRFETRAYVVTVKGKCSQAPMVHCSKTGKGSMCDDASRWGKACPELLTHKQLCDSTAPVDCTVSFPLADENGKLYTQLASVEVPLKA
ncbi:hypothetical protein LOZ65_005298 [Ophidiomyces ophidiicola]|nr:hypothetical protein LOZ65_005298 [Ophidiomyces ophidiicola]